MDKVAQERAGEATGPGSGGMAGQQQLSAQQQAAQPLFPAARQPDQRHGMVQLMALQQLAGHSAQARQLGVLGTGMGATGAAALQRARTAPPAAVGGVVQLLRLVEDKDGNLGDAGAPKRGVAVDKSVIDTTTLESAELAVLRQRIEGQAKGGVGLLKRLDQEIASKKGTGEVAGNRDSAIDLAAIFTADADLILLEVAEKNGAQQDRALLAKVTRQLESAYGVLAALDDIDNAEDAATYREVLASYTRRLRAIDPALDLKALAGQAVAVAGYTITDADRRQYRADQRIDGVWGGLAEAETVARVMGHQFDIFRIDAAAAVYRRVVTVGNGTGRQTGFNLLHLGNHYVAVNAGAHDGGALAPAHRIETTPDGNCMYEAILIVVKGRAPSAAELNNFVARMRGQVAAHLTDDAIDTSIVGLLSQGSSAGLGPDMRALLGDRMRGAQVGQLTPERLKQVNARFAALGADQLAAYASKRDDYLAKRAKAPQAADTRQAYAELDIEMMAGERALARQGWADKPRHVVLPLGWWRTVRDALGDSALQRESIAPLQALVASVEQYNTLVAAEKIDFKALFPLLDTIEEASKVFHVPPDKNVDAAVRELGHIALSQLRMVEVRSARQNLVRLYQWGEGSKYRVGAPGNRPDLHYDLYAQGTKKTLVTPTPSRFTKQQNDFADTFGASDKAKKKLSGHKEKQEGLSAAALRDAYPAAFSGIKPAPHGEASAVNVEYYDNQGNPWDQVAPRSYAKGDDGKDADGGAEMANSVLDHLKNKDFAHEKTRVIMPSGVILDCTYIDPYDYTRMWAELITMVEPDTLRDRVVEINVPFAPQDRKIAPKGAQGKNMALSTADKIDFCGQVPMNEFRVYPISVSKLAKHIPAIGAHIDAIFDGKYEDNFIRPYSNHNDHLPNQGSYFREYHVATGFSESARTRLVVDRPNRRVYLTLTHYMPWIMPLGDHLRNPFWQII